jgi:hypothetical protein
LSKNLGIQSDTFPVQQTNLCPDHPIVPQTLDPAPARCLRQSNQIRDVRGRQTRVMLQNLKDLSIKLI